MDKLDAFANTLVWEVNMLHSQGSGLERLTNMQGTYGVDRSDLPIGGRNSGLTYADRLTEGNLSLHFYDANTGESLLSGSLDFTNPHVPGGRRPTSTPPCTVWKTWPTPSTTVTPTPTTPAET